MKKYVFIIIILGVTFGFLTGIYLYKTNKIDIGIQNPIAELIEDECTVISKLNEEGTLDAKIASMTEEKVSPNANLIIKKYYTHCNHLITVTENIEKDLVNLTKEDLQKKYNDFKIESFSSDKIILYKEIDDFCDEHYVLREENGYVVIYKIDENNNETLFQETEISTEYLTIVDLSNIKNGIYVYTKQELNKILEDFE